MFPIYPQVVNPQAWHRCVAALVTSSCIKIIYPSLPHLLSFPQPAATVYSPSLHPDSFFQLFITNHELRRRATRLHSSVAEYQPKQSKDNIWTLGFLIYFSYQSKAQTTNMQSRIFLILSALAFFATSVFAAPVPVKMVARQEGAFTSTYIIDTQCHFTYHTLTALFVIYRRINPCQE